MHQALVFEVDLLANALAIKAREQRRGTGAIETLVVVKDLDPHRPLSQITPCSGKLFSIDDRNEKHHERGWATESTEIFGDKIHG